MVQLTFAIMVCSDFVVGQRGVNGYSQPSSNT